MGSKDDKNDTRKVALDLGLDPDKLPRHVAVIMDGNGRWAQQRGLERSEGHRAGAESLRDIVRFCGEIGIPYLTAYAFSTENWKRPKDEVDELMGLLVDYLYNEVEELNANGVKVRGIGRIEGLPADARIALAAAESTTAGNTRLTLLLALNYGGRSELVDAARAFAADVAGGRRRAGELTEEEFEHYLYTRGIPDPDLLIRPGGDYRISNFLLWQLAYTEFWITPVLWPDFHREHFIVGLKEYQRRERRYGGLG